MLSKKTSILVVDDDARTLRMIRRVLELEGYQMLTAGDGESALGILDKKSPQLVLLDIIMPDMDGFTVCRNIREFSQVPIIMVTARDNEEEKIEGLNAGADDYITKPFSVKELVARVRAVLRRSRLSDTHPETPAYYYPGLLIDFGRHRVIRDGQDVNLTATEYRLLSYLARNVGRVATPDRILEEVWGEEYRGELHLLQVSIARLRQKLKDDARNPRYILTRHGIGYIMPTPA